MHYIPLALPFFFALLMVFFFVVLLIELRILEYTYDKVGVNRRYMFLLLLFSFLGSYVNIPIARLPPAQVYAPQVVDFFGMHYVIPAITEWPGTVIAVNLGGAVIPVALSIYLAVKNDLYLRAVPGVAIVAAVTHLMARPVPGIGIAEPIFIPPVVAAAAAFVLSRRHTAPLAYISGSLGTLIGADLLNLGVIRGLGTPVASIGGAGKFDGIFLTGVIAVLLASMATSRGSRPPHTANPA